MFGRITCIVYCMYCHLLYVNKQFVINDELLEKSNQELGPFLIPLVLCFCVFCAISNCLSAKD